MDGNGDLAAKLLRELKMNVLRPDYPVADLLRACLLLGSELGSDALRSWATQELKGFDSVPIPDYRYISVQLSMDYQNGALHVTGQAVDPSMLPDWVRDAPGFSLHRIALTKSVDAIAAMMNEASDGGIRLTSGAANLSGIITATAAEPFFQAHAVYYKTSRPEFAAVLGAVRTQLTELLADMGGPLSELHTGAEADRMVEKNIIYTQNVYGNQGAISQGEQATATILTTSSVNGLLEDVQRVREAIAAEVASVPTELGSIVQQLDDELSQSTPDLVAVTNWRRRLLDFTRDSAIAPGVSAAVVVLTKALGTALGLGAS